MDQTGWGGVAAPALIEKLTTETDMNINPRIAMAGICLVALGWIVMTLIFEMKMGLPMNGIQWAKRAVGWGVEVWFMWVLTRGFVRFRNLPSR